MRWAAGRTPEARTPLYMRDNIHFSLLAGAYADFVIELAEGWRPARRAPSLYVESQGAFAERFAREMSRRVVRPCPVKIGVQTDFSEPMVRINTDPLDAERLGWSEAEAWDAVAAHHAAQLPLR